MNIVETERSLRELADPDLVGFLADPQIRQELVRLLHDATGIRPLWIRLGLWAVEQAANKLAADALTALAGQLVRIPRVEQLLGKLRELVGTADARAKLQAQLRALADGRGAPPELPKDTPADTAIVVSILAELRQWRGEFSGFDELRTEILTLADRLEDRLGPKPMLVTLEDSGQVLEYRRRAMPFLGREREIDYLRSFAHEDAGFRWALVTGAGGVGKSCPYALDRG